MGTTRVRIFYPADPVGIVPGGVDTFIRGIIKWAPENIEFSLIGMTTNPSMRPVGRWTRCTLGRREFNFFPVIHVPDAGKRYRIPLSLRYTFAVALMLKTVRQKFDVFEFHRVEPGLLFGTDQRPKNAFFHQNMSAIRAQKADILWKHFPLGYEAIERRVVTGLTSAWSVQEEGVSALKTRFPAQAETIRFIPTWVDSEIFVPLAEGLRTQQRKNLAKRFNINPAMSWIVSVGRLDTQKDPELLLSAFARLVSAGRRITLLVIGDGVLRPGLEKRVDAEGLTSRVHFLGLRGAREIAAILGVADVFALSSAYEGMPMAVLEALGCGLPVAAMDVGEVRRTVYPGKNGAITKDRSVKGFAACLENVLDHCDHYRGQPAVEAVQPFHPLEVLKPVYETYQELGLRVSPLSKRSDARG
jgi:glycosyltransferase involved in cell wall biosynthesis